MGRAIYYKQRMYRNNKMKNECKKKTLEFSDMKSVLDIGTQITKVLKI